MLFDFDHEEHERKLARRRFIATAAAGTVVAALGGRYLLANNAATREARKQMRPDGRPRLPPGQRVLTRLKPMGGRPGPTSRSSLQLTVHGAVDKPVTLDFEALAAVNTVERELDVHCVTGWSLLGAQWKGVRIRDLAQLVGVRDEARHVIFEAHAGYTANVRLDHAMADDSMVVWEHEGSPLATAHGAPLRSLVPDLYFWKSAKYLKGIRFVRLDEPGYWEVRGYNNHADPWKEERYA